MTPGVIALVLAAAALHAAWNAGLRSGADRLWAIIVMSLAAAAVAAPALPFVPAPAPASWPFLGLSVALHVGYSLALVKAYGSGDFGQVYPIARGSAPMLVTLGGLVFAGEVPPVATLAGIVLVSAGIIGLARAPSTAAAPLSLATALLTGLFIASYSISDGLGGRSSGHAVSYALWLFVLYAPALWLAFRLVRGRWTGAVDRDARVAAVGGVVSMVAYAMVIWAASVSPLGPVSAMRETSVVMAALIGRVVFGEPLTARRLAACCIIAGGAVLIGLR